MRAARLHSTALAVFVAGAAFVGASAPPAAAAPLIEVPITALQVGHDVSYPQCGSALPTRTTFSVFGGDGVRPYDVNPCLAEQIVWS